MSVDIINQGDKIIAALSGDIDHHNLKIIRGEIDMHLESSEPRWLIMDFSEVGFMDSSGIGLILGRKRILDSFGGNIAIKNANPGVFKIIKLAGLEGYVIDKTGKGGGK